MREARRQRVRVGEDGVIPFMRTSSTDGRWAGGREPGLAARGYGLVFGVMTELWIQIVVVVAQHGE